MKNQIGKLIALSILSLQLQANAQVRSTPTTPSSEGGGGHVGGLPRPIENLDPFEFVCKVNFSQQNSAGYKTASSLFKFNSVNRMGYATIETNKLNWSAGHNDAPMATLMRGHRISLSIFENKNNQMTANIDLSLLNSNQQTYTESRSHAEYSNKTRSMSTQVSSQISPKNSDGSVNFDKTNILYLTVSCKRSI